VADLMETAVSRYVSACERRGWRPVFTTEQMRVILKHTGTVLPPWMEGTPRAAEITWETVCSGTCRLFGVIFKVDDTPRPPMPEEMLDRDSGIEEPERQPRWPPRPARHGWAGQPKLKGKKTT